MTEEAIITIKGFVHLILTSEVVEAHREVCTYNGLGVIANREI